jgi:hypothetical protein
MRTIWQMKRKTTGRLEFTLEDHLLWVIDREVSVHVVSKNSKTVLRFIKLPVGMIVPDLVLVASSEHDKPAGRTDRVPSLFECEVLAKLLRRGPLCRSKLARLLYARDSSLDRAVVRLTRDKLLRLNRAGVLAVPKNAFPPHIEIVSIEAKLRRWKDAIRQAKEYRRFSNHSYVALPKTVVEDNPRLQKACVREGVGLIAVSQKGTELVLAAKNVKPITAEWIWLIRKTESLQTMPRRVSYLNGHNGSATSRKRSKA